MRGLYFIHCYQKGYCDDEKALSLTFFPAAVCFRRGFLSFTPHSSVECRAHGDRYGPDRARVGLGDAFWRRGSRGLDTERLTHDRRALYVWRAFGLRIPWDLGHRGRRAPDGEFGRGALPLGNFRRTVSQRPWRFGVRE